MDRVRATLRVLHGIRWQHTRVGNANERERSLVWMPGPIWGVLGVVQDGDGVRAPGFRRAGDAVRQLCGIVCVGRVRGAWDAGWRRVAAGSAVQPLNPPPRRSFFDRSRRRRLLHVHVTYCSQNMCATIYVPRWRQWTRSVEQYPAEDHIQIIISSDRSDWRQRRSPWRSLR